MFLSSFFFDTLNSAKAEVLRCGLSQRAIAGKGSHYIDQIMIVYLYIVDPWVERKLETNLPKIASRNIAKVSIRSDTDITFAIRK